RYMKRFSNLENIKSISELFSPFLKTPKEKSENQFASSSQSKSLSPSPLEIPTKIFKTLKKWGLNPEIDSFMLYPLKFAIIRIQYLIYCGIFFENLIFWIFSGFSHSETPFIWEIFINITLIAMSLFWIYFKNKGKINKKSKFTKEIPVKNLYISQLSRKNQELHVPMSKIIFSAHYDGIEYQFHGKLVAILRKIIPILKISILILNPIMCASFILYFNIWHQNIQFYYIISIVLLILNFIGLSLMIVKMLDYQLYPAFRKNTNSSPMIILLALIKQMKESKIDLEWCDFQVIFSGGGELEGKGNEIFIQKNLNSLKLFKDVYIIDLDSITDDLYLFSQKKKGSPQKLPNIKQTLLEFIEHHLVRYRIPFISKNYNKFPTGAYIPFARHNFNIVSLGIPQFKFGIYNEDLYTLEDLEQMEKLTEVLFNLILTLDKRIGNKIYSGE
ncbi:MAG: hypothetical protein ACTSWL_05800, partial [Promethearchaeota archaeon]